MHAITIRLNEEHYAALARQAAAAQLSPTSFAREIVVEGIGDSATTLGIDEIEPETEIEPSDPSCIRAARHEPGVPCPVCQAA